MTVSEIRNAFETQLGSIYNQQEIRSILTLLMEHYLQWSRSEVQFRINSELDDEITTCLMDALHQLYNGKPVQYITGFAWFDGQRYMVSGDVLIPRQETEELCHLIRSDLKQPGQGVKIRLLDIGTGSGCIAVNLKTHLPWVEITAADISDAAIGIAMKNAREMNCTIDFRQCNILDPDQSKTLGNFRVIVSNPPYVTSQDKLLMHQNVVCHEPALALYVPDTDPLIFYRTILSFGRSALSLPGTIYFEINERYGEELKRLAATLGYCETALLEDIHGKPRFLRTHYRG